MGQFAALRTQKIEGFEELKEVVLGTRREIVQLERGKIKGEIAHAVIGDLPIDTASFNLGIRTKGGSHKDRIGIGLLAASANHVVRSSYDSRPGDVLVMQPGCEHENRYYGGASMIIVMASEGDIESSYGTEARMCDPTCWWRNHYKGDGEMVTSVIPHLQSLLGRLRDLSLTAEATEFWKRAVIEAVTTNVMAGMPSERDGPLPSALKIVRQVEEYLDARPANLSTFPRFAATSTRRDVRCIARSTRRSGPARSLSFATAGCVPPTPRCARQRTSGRSRISRCSSDSRISAGLPATTINCLASTRPKRGSGTGHSLVCHSGKSADECSDIRDSSPTTFPHVEGPPCSGSMPKAANRKRRGKTPPHISDYPMSHSPLWMSNFTRPSSRIFRSRDWQASSFGRLARRMSW